MTAEEVAELFRLPRPSVYQYARREVDPMPSLKIGRHIRFLRADLESWIAEQRKGRFDA